MAVDGDTAQIGPELAGALNVPCAVGVAGLPAVTDGTVTVQREFDAGVATAAFPLPAVLTVAKDVAELRMASIAGILAAEDAEISVLSAEAAGADARASALRGPDAGRALVRARGRVRGSRRSRGRPPLRRSRSSRS